MIRFVFRFLSLVALCLAVIAAVMDSIASVSVSDYVVTPFGIAWLEISPTTLDQASVAVEHYIGPWAWKLMLQWILPQPTIAVFLVLALLFWMIGYKKPSLAGRFAA